MSPEDYKTLLAQGVFNTNAIDKNKMVTNRAYKAAMEAGYGTDNIVSDGKGGLTLKQGASWNGDAATKAYDENLSFLDKYQDGLNIGFGTVNAVTGIMGALDARKQMKDDLKNSALNRDVMRNENNANTEYRSFYNARGTRANTTGTRI